MDSNNFRARVFCKVTTKALRRGREFSRDGLRHTFACLYMAHGSPLEWIQAQGGWASATMLVDVSGHFMAAQTHGFVDVLTALHGPYAAERVGPARRGLAGCRAGLAGRARTVG
jgi:hypothetical protein